MGLEGVRMCGAALAMHEVIFTKVKGVMRQECTLVGKWMPICMHYTYLHRAMNTFPLIFRVLLKSQSLATEVKTQCPSLVTCWQVAECPVVLGWSNKEWSQSEQILFLVRTPGTGGASLAGRRAGAVTASLMLTTRNENGFGLCSWRLHVYTQWKCVLTMFPKKRGSRRWEENLLFPEDLWWTKYESVKQHWGDF